ncbi:hypothetical protein BKA93DRAFT_816243 [Sparassis latifolia]
MHRVATRIHRYPLTRNQWTRLNIFEVVPSCRRKIFNSAVSSDNIFHSSGTQENGQTGAQKAHCAPFHSRTHTCGALSSTDAESRVVLTGWLLPERKLNKTLSFFSIKDSYGSTQLVVSANAGEYVLQTMRDIPVESTVLVEGTVRMRPQGQRRALPAGDVEVVVDRFKLLNPADRNLPFMPSDSQNLANEELRLRYRHLDLRRTALTENLRKRSEVARLMRTVFEEEGFTEVETPMLLKSTPEGAREFVVPTRVVSASGAALMSPDSEPTVGLPQPLFYTLPQSPQQPKQLLVASGAVDRYYQLARCFRDEDGRKDRQPEFTQVDLEMAWVSWGESQEHSQDSNTSTGSWNIGGSEVRDVVEKLIRRVWSSVEGIDLPHFQVMPYEEAMSRFGSDKPDLRFGLEIQDITPHLPPSARTALSERQEIIEALVVSKSDADDLGVAAKQLKRQEREYIERIEVTEESDATWYQRSKLISELTQRGESASKNINNELGISEGGTVWLMKRHRKPEGGSTALGRLRLLVATAAEKLGYKISTNPKFLWVTEFPLFMRGDADKEFLTHGRRSSTHHPFTAPMWQDIEKMYAGRFDEVRGQHYDLVLNGVEVGGGSVRIHDAGMQEFIFTNILQLDEREKSSFHHLLHALRCGAPPHGGFAFGFDRLMTILCKAESIRDVIAFPKTGAGTDLLFRSPAPVGRDVLDQYGIQPTHSALQLKEDERSLEEI